MGMLGRRSAPPGGHRDPDARGHRQHGHDQRHGYHHGRHGDAGARHAGQPGGRPAISRPAPYPRFEQFCQENAGAC
jgi:hypothetical protein